MLAGPDPWSIALLVVTAVHATFQLTVSTLVYPALAATPAEHWDRVHAAHSRRITPLVGVVYLAVPVACGGVLLHDRGPASLAACVLSGAALLVTAGLAAPLHGRLGAARSDDLVDRLLVVDRLRTACALGAVVAAVLTL